MPIKFQKARKACLAVSLLVVCCAMVWAQDPPPAADAVRPELPPTNDPTEIVRRALEQDQRDFQLQKNYTFEDREELKVMGRGGAVKKHDINTYDVTILYDEPYARRIRKNDQPLNAKDESKEAAKVDKFVAERQNESPNEHQKRLAKQEKERQEARAFVREVINAYDFRLAGEETLDGHDAYVIDATPRKDFHPTQPHADILPKLRGKIWINKKDFGCVKLEAETLDTISFGLFLVRIHKGTRIQYEQTRVNDEIWLPRRISVDATGRVALFASGAVDWKSDFSNYKKFTSGVRILPGAAEVQPPAAPGR
jgi:hypothetical protein